MEHDGNNEHRKIKSYDKDCRQYKTIELESQRRASLVKMLGRFEMLRVLQFPESIIFQIQTLFKAGLKYRFLHHYLLFKSPHLSKAAKNTEDSICRPLATLVNFMHDLFYCKAVAAFAANRLAAFPRGPASFPPLVTKSDDVFFACGAWSAFALATALEAFALFVMHSLQFSGAQQNAALRPASCIANV